MATKPTWQITVREHLDAVGTEREMREFVEGMRSLEMIEHDHHTRLVSLERTVDKLAIGQQALEAGQTELKREIAAGRNEQRDLINRVLTDVASNTALTTKLDAQLQFDAGQRAGLATALASRERTEKRFQGWVATIVGVLSLGGFGTFIAFLAGAFPVQPSTQRQQTNQTFIEAPRQETPTP